MHEEPVAVRVPGHIAHLAGGESEASHLSRGQVADQQLPALGVGEEAAIWRNSARRVPKGHRAHLVGGGQVDGTRARIAPGGGGERRRCEKCAWSDA